MFQPAGDAVLCRCNHVIDMSRGQEVPVEAEPTVTVSGLRYNVRGEGGGGGVERWGGGEERWGEEIPLVVEQKKITENAFYFLLVVVLEGGWMLPCLQHHTGQMLWLRD